MSVDDYQHNTLAQVSNLASITADLAVRRPDLNPVLPPKNTKAGGWFQVSLCFTGRSSKCKGRSRRSPVCLCVQRSN